MLLLPFFVWSLVSKWTKQFVTEENVHCLIFLVCAPIFGVAHHHFWIRNSALMNSLLAEQHTKKMFQQKVTFWTTFFLFARSRSILSTDQPNVHKHWYSEFLNAFSPTACACLTALFVASRFQHYYFFFRQRMCMHTNISLYVWISNVWAKKMCTEDCFLRSIVGRGRERKFNKKSSKTMTRSEKRKKNAHDSMRNAIETQ